MTAHNLTCLKILAEKVPECQPGAKFMRSAHSRLWYAAALWRDSLTEWLCKKDMKHALPNYSVAWHPDRATGWWVESGEFYCNTPDRLTCLIALVAHVAGVELPEE